MENIGIGAGLAALAFWGFVAVVVVAGIWDGIRKRDIQHETIRRLIESGQPVDQDLMEKLSLVRLGTDTRYDRDLRLTGLWIMPVAVGMAVFALILGFQYPEALGPLLGVSGLLAVMGTGFLISARIARRWYPADRDSEE